MKLRELLDARRIVVPLKARSVRDATRQLAKSLVASGAVRDEPRLTELLKSEWPEDIVSVAGRAFLPHFRTDAAGDLALAMGIAAEPICLADDPNRCARIVVLIIAPVAMASEYLRAMSAVASALASDDSLAALHAARSAEEILAVPTFGDVNVPPEVTVGDLMSTQLTSIGPDTTLKDAAQLMQSRKVRAVPVIGPAGEVLGLLDDGHLLRHLLPQTVSQLSTGQYRAAKRPARGAKASTKAPHEVLARDVMDRTVLCLSEDQSIADVSALMLAKEADRFPVTRDGALVGFLTRGDIVRKLLGA